MTTNEELLAERYGAKKPNNPIRNRVLSILGVAGLVAMAGYFALANYSPAEDYHQDFFERNPHQGYCMAVAAPKVAKFRKTFARLTK